MFERPHHQRILKILQCFDTTLLARANCFFGGGTAIVLALGEYRESVDIDFLCSDVAGYRLLRTSLALPRLGAVVNRPVDYVREVRTERDKISTFLRVDEAPIKVEFVLEGRISIGGANDPALGVPVLDRVDMYAEKLLANTDRGLDRSTMSRDLIDLGMMIRGWGPIPAGAWAKAQQAYGSAVAAHYGKCLALVEDREHLRRSMRAMSMDTDLADELLEALKQEAPAIG